MDEKDFPSTTDPSSYYSNSDKTSDKDPEEIISKTDIKENHEYKYKLYAFVIISLLQIFVNFNIGAVPIMVNWIQEPYNFTSTELGIMGSLPYGGYLIFSLFVSHILFNYSTKKSITVGLFFNLLSLVIFALSVNKYMFFFSNFCIGASQSAFSTYYPIWVDTFAPKFHRNLWMSILQGGAFTGSILGYVATSLYSYAGDNGWRYSILTQIIFGSVLTILFYFIPKEFVNFDPSRDEHLDFDLCTCNKSNSNTAEMDSTNKSVCLSNTCDDLSEICYYKLRRYTVNIVLSKASTLAIKNNQLIERVYSTFHNSINKSEYSKCNKCFINNVKLYQETMNVKKLSVWSKFKLLIKQHVYILTCIAMSALYFVVSGINFWMTKIGVDHIGISERTFYFIFTLQVSTGMSFGIISGSYLIDQIIYHYPEHPLLVDIVLIIYTTFAIFFGIILILFQIPIVYGFCIFILIFSGASIVPTLVLQSVAYLPYNLKPVGSLFFMCQYQIFGYMFGIIMPGVAKDIFNSYTAALCVIYLPGFITLFSLLSIFYIKLNKIKTKKLKIKC
ncbi:integral membrane protein family I, putative [Theileria annulata]|uniref:Integral membrane protein family I, putative n=1 Tax=Theileria annulata TaxID=5874 RepID=Q4UCA5_THEAN|nr:integral membrane protein family I, putative [Theileria annulata]CAI75546.1 integral membrane protein family I, putative [Theileria annulata]|eukprot:XP_955022.1 integral membrane protein family I, putative [Theileria annulata]